MMDSLPICQKCVINCGGQCAALSALSVLYDEKRREEKAELLQALREQLDLIDYFPSDTWESLGKRVLDQIEELWYVKDFNVRIAYVESWERKVGRTGIVFADCRRVNGPFRAFLPYDIILTFYIPNTTFLTDNQCKILMWHELKHIHISPKVGITVKPHDTNDFSSILASMGLDWTDPDKEVPDILGE